ncbi:MAG: secondary thiamine-phosphate synthase enzyme YjbQ [candidate division KSB1 bacterium]|nr:secondary thiamine-phosphate synthase enzyme YjbQ [candidate division KSB1 bacterium]MDZ7318303.1 secondary thiamine-phosphate synthase enzyme YjbQ [candidate division KSB1 bacterium]MDZ7342451.1 secondary thiamine-phosphate synthase enzyme YjbQ [candidate division KSB1 bacterium]
MSKTLEYTIATSSRTEVVPIDHIIEKAIKESGVKEGICGVFVPHTTAGVTINENTDPNVKLDILKTLNKLIPFSDNYAHIEGNSAAHIKSSLVGCSVTIIIEDGKPLLGTWQSVFFCEFDGPRKRKVWVKIR